MLEILNNLFFQNQFMPHGHCYLWQPELVWLHVVSDSLTAVAYYSIPIMLVYFVRQRRDVPFDWIFWMFGAFIASCGTSHLMEVWTLWHPAYWVSGVIKAVTAAVSLYTALELFWLIPQALTLPSPAQLKAANQKLAQEIKQRQQQEEALQKSETRYRAIVEDQTELICRFGPEGVLSFVNEAYCRYFSKSRVELIGRSFCKFLPPVEVNKIKETLATLTLEKPTATIEHQVKMADGELHWHRWINRAIFDSEDNLLEYQAVGQDITALREKDRRLQAIFNQTFQFIGLLKPDGTILEANQTFLDFAGVAPEQILGQEFEQASWWFKRNANLGGEVDKTRIKQRLKEAIASAARGEFVRDEFDLMRGGNPFISIDFSLKPVFDENQQVVLLIAEGRDITERKLAEAKVRSLNAELEERVRERTEGLKQANLALKNRIRQQQVVAELGKKALSIRDISLLMNETVALVAKTLDFEYCKILELLPGKKSLLLRAGIGWQEGLVGRAVVDTGIESQAGYTLRESKPIIVEDLRTETRFTGPQLLRDHDVVSGMSVTISGKDSPFGVLGVHTKQKCLFAKHDVYFILAVANLLAAAIERESTEADLREREEMFAELTDNIHQVFWMSSLDKRQLIYVSPAYQEIWGRSLISVYQQPESFLLEDVHPEDRDLVMAGIEKQREGAFAAYEYRLLRSDGSIRWLVTKAFPVSDRAGKIYRTAGISEDITERKQIEMELFQEKELAKITLKSIGDAVITTDEKGRINYLNPIAEKITGWQLTEANGLPVTAVFRLIHEITREPLEDPVTRVFLEEQIVSLAENSTLITRNGIEYAIEDSAAPIRNQDGQILGAVVVFRDVSETRKMARLLSWQAKHDALTGLANRLVFEQCLKTSIKGVLEDGEEHTLCYLDLDRFKIVNDTCGHAAGDELLRQISSLLKSRCRKVDLIARLGGDEFGLLLLQCNLDNGKRVARELIDIVRGFRFVWEEQSFSIGVSIGLLALTKDHLKKTGLLSTDKILTAADSACYIAKYRGRNCFHIYRDEDSPNDGKSNDNQWIGEIETACDRDGFEIHYKHILSVRSNFNDICYYEIMLVFKNQHGESIPATAFLPAAERYNLMSKIDRWTIAHLFSYLSSYVATNLDCGERIFAISLSGDSLSDEDFLNFLLEQFEQHQILPQRICFQIKAREAIANLTKITPSFDKLAKLGCNFTLDEFGSSLSKFALLKNLPVDYLKIDSSLLKDLSDDPINYAVVEAINRIGHLMGLKTIANFVPNDTILAKIRIIGIDYVISPATAKLIG